jgi:hypothetical protein
MTKREKLQTSMNPVSLLCLIAMACVTGFSISSAISILIKFFIIGFWLSVTLLIFFANKFYLKDESVKK